MEFRCSVCNYTSEYKKSIERHFENKAKCGDGKPELIEVPIEIKCESCNKLFTTKYNMRKHTKICKKLNVEKEIQERIPLKDKKGNIKAYAIVDNDDYEKVIEYKWHVWNGYASNSRKVGSLHRFIMNAQKEDIVDHINGNKLDNRKSNLRFVSHSQNAQNKPKYGCVSKYKGVGFHKHLNRWSCRISIDYKRTSFSFEKEEHAAYWYDQLAIKHFGKDAKINGVQKPDDFVEPIDKYRNLPKGIYKSKSGKFYACIYGRGLGTFDSLDEALCEYNNNIKSKHMDTNILRNKDGIAIITTSKNEEILVDDNKYCDLIKYRWCINKHYSRANINGKITLMHRYLINAQRGDIIDHINRNKNDNRLENLRISNLSYNAHNTSKRKNVTSKYIGVSTKSNKFISSIAKNKKTYYLGMFDNERDAALAYNKKALELYGEYANLNVIEV
jgi:hypothetical protein